MREKVKADPEFRERLVHFISQTACETLPPSPPASTTEDFTKGSRCFQPLLNPDHPHFQQQMQIDVHDIVRSRNMHKKKHTPTCFKNGRKRCRARFPRKLVAYTRFDLETGILFIQRDDQWLNGFNKWISIMTHGNHDCQFLLTKNHALSIIYYVIKYISKPEAAFHTKLTIAAAVRDAMRTEFRNHMTDVDIAKKFLIKTYNKLDTQREVGMPEAISHLLDVPDHYTDATFASLHTVHILLYAKKLERHQSQNDEEYSENEALDSELIRGSRGYALVSQSDDYLHRGPIFRDYCLYDYVSLVYKGKRIRGINFTPEHPQHRSHYQHICKEPPAIPNLLGRLLFVSKDSKDSQKREDYYCLICLLFIPWSHQNLHTRKPNQSWQEFYEENAHKISTRLQHYINNLDLLHKSKEESRIDAMQQRAKSDEDVMENAWYDDEDIEPSKHDYDFADNGDDNDNPDHDSDVDENTIVQRIISHFEEGGDADWYVHEATDANMDAGYLSSQNDVGSVMIQEVQYCSIPTDQLKQSIKNAEIQMEHISNNSHEVVHPAVFLTGAAEIKAAITRVLHKFTFNVEQARAFRIVAEHSLGISRIGDQLLMGTFGDGGTGKSRLVDAIQYWFQEIKQEYRLIVTAMTGAAAVKINGSTLHSAVGIAVESGDRDKVKSRVTDKDVTKWKEVDYIIIDEVSMMDAKVMVQLNERLNLLKGTREQGSNAFGGINLLFYGDFYQLPAVSRLDLWRKKLGHWQQGHDLWRSLNAVVILTKQMRQAQDQRYAEAMRRVRLHEPTNEDIEMLNSRSGAPIPDSLSAPIVVRHHSVCHAINVQKLNDIAYTKNLAIIHCKARVIARHGISIENTYSIIQGPKKTLGDAILSLVPGAPLMITKNLKYLPVHLVNGTIVKFYGFANVTPQKHESGILSAPQYMLVKLLSEESIIEITGLPPNIVPIWAERFKYNPGHGRWVKLEQFPVTLAYAISDYKCQGQSYDCLRVDIKKPNTGNASVMSPYVQLSRSRSLQGLSILRPFDPDDLRAPIPEELSAELEWEQKMSDRMAEIYP